jgi:AbrB family looped-hinge helix DNA binding protein
MKTMSSELLLTGSSKVTSRGQITLPQNVREKYDIHPGDVIYFLEKGRTLIIRKGPMKIISSINNLE